VKLFLAIVACVYLLGWVYLLYCFKKIVVDDLLAKAQRHKGKP